MPELHAVPAPPDPPDYPPGGSLVNDGIGGGRIINNSECLASSAKLTSMPTGWEVVERGRLKEEYRRNEVRAELVWKGPDNLASRLAFKQWVLGYSRTVQPVDLFANLQGLPFPNNVPAPPPPRLTREPPASYPGVPFLYAISCMFEAGDGTTKYDASAAPLDANGNPLLDANGNPFPSQLPVFYDSSSGSDWLSARARVEYAHLPYNVLSDSDLAAIQGSQATTPELDRFTELQVHTAITSIPLRPGTLQFTPGGASLGPDHPGQVIQGGQVIPDIANHRFEPTNEVYVRWYAVDFIPWAALDAMVATVNAVPFGGAKAWGRPPFAPDTLLLQPLKSYDRYRDARGRVMYDLLFSWLEKPAGGWNALPDATGDKYPVQFKRSGAPLYRRTDHNDLFKPVLVNY